MTTVHYVYIWPALTSIMALAQSNPVPFVNQPLLPDATSPGGATLTLTVNGTGFVSGATVNWNGTALATTFVSSSVLTATVPATDIAAAHTASVTVTNPAPGGGTSGMQFLSVTNPVTTVTLAESDSVTGLIPGNGGIVVGDFNGDGKLDLATPSGPLSLLGPILPGMCVLLGVGDVLESHDLKPWREKNVVRGGTG